MFDFHEKRKIRSVLYSIPVILVIFLIAILLSISAYHRYTVAKEMEQKLESKRDELYTLQERAKLIESKVEYLSDERGVEEELRSRFDAIRDGEQVVILLDDKKGEVSKSEKTIEEVDTPETFWQSVMRTFKFW